MRATPWLVGCALCFAGFGSAMAASPETQGLDNSPRTPIDNVSPHDSTIGSGGDALGLNRDCPPANNGDGSNGTAGCGNDHSGGSSSPSVPTRRMHLSWQSLLPGSIQ